MDNAASSIEERIRRLEDLEEIRDLRMRYHYYINEGRYEDMPELFTEDALIDFGSVGTARGKEQIRAFYASAGKSLDLIVQFIHNHMVEVNGDAASGIAYLDARYAREGVSMIVAGRFTETYVRSQSGWRIDKMDVESFFTVPLSEGWAAASIQQARPFD